MQRGPLARTGRLRLILAPRRPMSRQVGSLIALTRISRAGNRHLRPNLHIPVGECSPAATSFIRNHHIPEDLPCTVRLFFPYCQISFNQAFASAECGLSLAPFVNKASVLGRSPSLHACSARSSKAFELRCHMPLDLKPSPNTLPRATAIDRIFGIC